MDHTTEHLTELYFSSKKADIILDSLEMKCEWIKCKKARLIQDHIWPFFQLFIILYII